MLRASLRADLALARRMAARLVHRGPDEEGGYLSSDGRCAIGFRRLCVIDPSGSHQPMTSADGLATVAFNGEIYNFRQLRAQLSAEGAPFRTAGDTEVLLHMYQRRGLEMFSHLTGMFALALYDAVAGRLILARDRLGEKPLWYAALADRIVFASEAKAVLAHPMVSKACSNQAVASYCTMGYVPAPNSIYRDLAKLPPASFLVAQDSSAPPTPYWEPARVEAPTSDNAAVEMVRSEVVQAVEQRLVSDVPLGVLLSGGIDSAIVTAVLARSAGRGGGGVKTFTAAFDDPSFDESLSAQRVASSLGTDHSTIPIHCSPLDAIDRIVETYDEPFGDSSALPTFLICQAARSKVTVALTGDGGDEVFGGYDRYRALQLASSMGFLPYAGVKLAAALLSPFGSKADRSLTRRLGRLAKALSYPPSVQYFMFRRLFGPEDLLRLFSQQFAAGIDPDGPARWFCDLYESFDCPDEVAVAQRHDLATYLPDDLLVKTDIASMACSLELRAPLLDHNLVSLGLSLPTAWKIRHRKGKHILRQAFADWLPREVFTQPKRGFGVPLGRWLQNELRPVLQETLLDPSLEKAGIFDRQSLMGLMADHFSGRDDHGHRLWALLIFARWLARQGG